MRTTHLAARYGPYALYGLIGRALGLCGAIPPHMYIPLLAFPHMRRLVEVYRAGYMMSLPAAQYRLAGDLPPVDTG